MSDSSGQGAGGWTTPAGQPSWSSPLPAPPGWGGPPPPKQPAFSAGDRRPVVPLRPLGLGELLDGAVSVVRSYPRSVFAVAGVVALVGAGLQLLVILTLVRPLLLLNSTEGSLDLGSAGGELAGAGIGYGLSALLAVFSGLLLAGLVAPAVSRGMLGQTLSPRELWAQLRPRLAPLVGVCAGMTVAVIALPALGIGLTALLVLTVGNAAGLAGILLVPTGLVLAPLLYVRWAFAPLCVVLEKQGARAALARSSLLVRRSWWRVLGVLVLASIVAGVVSQILQLPFVFASGASANALFSGKAVGTSVLVVTAIGSAVSTTVVGPFTAAVRGLLYVDRRMRAEGLDVALSAALAGPAVTPGGA